MNIRFEPGIPLRLQGAKERGKASVQGRVLGMIPACSIEERMLDYMMDWDGVRRVLAEEGVVVVEVEVAAAAVEVEVAAAAVEEELVLVACSKLERKRAGRSFEGRLKA